MLVGEVSEPFMPTSPFNILTLFILFLFLHVLILLFAAGY